MASILDDILDDAKNQSVSKFVGSVKRGTGNLLTTTARAGQEFGVDLPTLNNYGQKLVDQNPADVNTAGDIINKPTSTITEGIGENVPQLAAEVGSSKGGSLAGRGIGMAVGALTENPANIARFGNVGAKIGGAVGFYAPTFVQELGTNLQGQDQTGDHNTAKAVAGAAVATGLEQLGEEKLLKRVFKIPGGGAIPERGASTLADIAKAGLRTAGIEGATEAAQTGVERLSAGQSLTDQNAINDFTVSAAKGATGGFGFGAGTRGAEIALDRGDVSRGTAGEQPQQNQQVAGGELGQPQAPLPVTEIDPARGPLSRAVAAGVGSGAVTGVSVRASVPDNAGSQLQPITPSVAEAPAPQRGATGYAANVAPFTEGSPKQYLKNVIDQLPAPAPEHLPNNPAAYFDASQADALAPLSALRWQPEAEAAPNAIKRMAAAADGAIARRGPLDVKANADGTFDVLDGGATVTAAQQLGMGALPIRIKEADQGSEAWRLPRGYLSPEANDTLTQAYQAAAADKPQFDAALQHLASATGSEALIPDLKGRNRAEQKIAADYGGDPTKIKDLLRGTLVANSLTDAQSMVQALGQQYQVVDAKNSLDPNSPSPYSGGYRDAKLVVRTPTGALAEIQVVPKEMQAAKDQAHPLYEQERTITAEAQRADRDLTPEEVTKLEAVRASQAAIYQPAWARILANSAGETPASAPGLSSNPASNLRGAAPSYATSAPEPSSNLTQAQGTPSRSNNSEPGGGSAGNGLEATGNSGNAQGTIAEPKVSIQRDGSAIIEGDRRTLAAQLKVANVPALPAVNGVRVAAQNIERAKAALAGVPNGQQQAAAAATGAARAAAGRGAGVSGAARREGAQAALNTAEYAPLPQRAPPAPSFSANPRQPDAVSAYAVHYSNTPGLRALDPAMAGTGSAGRERRRFGLGNFGKSGGTSARTYFYVQTDTKTPAKESAVGGSHVYRTRLDNLYDVERDPRGFVKEAGVNPDYLEELIADAGFDGMIVPPPGGGIESPVALTFNTNGKKIPVVGDSNGKQIRASVAEAGTQPVQERRGVAGSNGLLAGKAVSDAGRAAWSKRELRRQPFVRNRIDLARRGTLRLYAGESGSGASQVRGVKQRFTPSPLAERLLRENGLPSFPMSEMQPGTSDFAEALTASKAASPFGASVYVYPQAEYAGMRTFLSDDRKAGFAIKPDGDIVSVFSDGGGKAHAMLLLATQEGGTKLDAFDTVLPFIYSLNGFKEVRREAWNEAYKPDGWNKADFADYNNGEPDVVYMEYDPIHDPFARAKDGSLLGLPRKVGEHIAAAFRPAQDAAAQYMKSAGLDYRPPSRYVNVDPKRARSIAQAYEEMKDEPDNPKVKAAYEALARETVAQYKAVLDTGLKVEFIPEGVDPYNGDPRNAIDDIRNNNHLWVFPTSAGFGTDAAFDASKHPNLQPTEFTISGKPALVNDLFRVVHDYFGHAKEGVGFRADGEENAWRAHAAMFSPLARQAMTTSTRGQNSWVNYGPFGEKNRNATQDQTTYANQKAGLLPEWVTEAGATDLDITGEEHHGLWNLEVFAGAKKIGDGFGYLEDFGGHNNALHLGYMGLVEEARGHGLGKEAIKRAVEYLRQAALKKLRGLPADERIGFVSAEAMSKKSLSAMHSLYGEPQYLANNVRELTMQEALDMLPADAQMSQGGELIGPKVDVVFKLPAKARALLNTTPDGQLPFARVSGEVTRLTKRWQGGPQVEVVPNFESIPDEVRTQLPAKANAAYDGSGTLYIVANRMRGGADIRAALAHEAYAHYGTKAMLGPQWGAFLARVSALKESDPSIRSAADSVFQRYGELEPDVEADEIVAHLAENYSSISGRAKLMMAQVIAAVKDFMRNRLGINLDWTASDVLDMIARAKRHVQVGDNFVADGAGAARASVPTPADFDGWTLPTDNLTEQLTASAGKRLNAYSGVVKAKGDALRTMFQDYFLPVRRVQEAIKRAGGNIAEDADVYTREELYYGRTGQQLQELEDEHVKPLIKALVDSGVSQQDLELYLYAKFAPSRNARIAKINPALPDGGSGMTNADAAKILADFQQAGLQPKLEALAKRVYAMNDIRTQALEQSGLLSADEAQMWKSEASYVPLKGFAQGTKVEPGTRLPVGGGFSVGGREAWRALGRRTRASDIIANVVAQTEQAIIRSEKNRVAQALLKLAQANPNESLWNVNATQEKPTFNNRTGEVEYRTAVEPNAIIAKVNGEEYRVNLYDNRLLDAMKNMGAAKVGAILRGFSAANRFLSLTRTTLAPEFVLSNFARDLQTAAVNLTGEQSAGLAAKVVGNVPQAMRSMWMMRRGNADASEWGQWAREFAEQGGMTHFMVQRTVEEQQAKIESLLRETRGGVAGASRKVIRATLDLVEDANSAVENGVRLSAYANARKQGMSAQQAASLAKNLTVNFNRKGSAGPAINAMYLFYNASIQGAHRFLRAMKSPKVRAIMASTAILGLAMGFYNRAAGGKDDDGQDKWDKIPDWQKQRYFIILHHDGTMTKFPMPYTYNLPYLLGQEMSDVIFGNKEPSSAAANMMNGVVNAFNPIGNIDFKGDITHQIAKLSTPTVTMPFLDIALNENFFESPIMPEQDPYSKVPTPDSYRYFPSTNPEAVALAQELNRATGGNAVRSGAIDISPASMVYVMDYLTGGIGSFFERTGTAASLALRGQPVPLHEIPFSRVFVDELSEHRVQDTYYQAAADVEQKFDMARLAAKPGGFADATESEKQEMAFGRRMISPEKTAEKQLRAVRKALKYAQAQNDDARVQALKEREQAIMLRFNRTYFAAMEQFNQKAQ